MADLPTQHATPYADLPSGSGQYSLTCSSDGNLDVVVAGAFAGGSSFVERTNGTIGTISVPGDADEVSWLVSEASLDGTFYLSVSVHSAGDGGTRTLTVIGDTWGSGDGCGSARVQIIDTTGPNTALEDLSGGGSGGGGGGSGGGRGIRLL